MFKKYVGGRKCRGEGAEIISREESLIRDEQVDGDGRGPQVEN